ncbi:MAG: site-2 protease family protein [Pseudomonadota bacterium]
MENTRHPSHFRNQLPGHPAGLEIARGFGIPLVLDRSLLIATVFVVVSVALGPFGALHSDWSSVTLWSVAVLAALGLFVSIYLHELGHALVAARFGLKTRRITLFILGGMAEMADEPRSAREEFWIAVAGPAVSVLLGGLLLAGVALGDAAGGPELTQEPEAFLADLGPLASLALWLGNLNVILALFNLIPAFPLDGGRVLRSAIWAYTGDGLRSTRWASASGRWFGLTLIATGILMLLGVYVPLFGQGLGGLWLALIGWFVTRSAAGSVKHAELKNQLADRPVAALMQSNFAHASPWTTLAVLVDDIARPRNQRSVPVLADDGRLLGLVTPNQVKETPAERWAFITAGDVMQPVTELVVASETDRAMDALLALLERGSEVLAVLDRDGRCVGLLSADQANRWLSAED